MKWRDFDFKECTISLYSCQIHSSMNSTINGCESAAEIYSNQPLRWAGFLQIFISLIALATFVYVNIYMKNQSLVPIHLNLKVLYFTTALISAVHALGLIITESTFEYKRQTSQSNPCEMQWITWHCLIFRSPILVSIPSFTLLHAGITIERFFATVSARTYEKMSYTLSATILASISCFVFISSYEVVHNAVWTAKHDYCFLSSVASGEAMQFIYKLMFLINIPVTFMDILLLSQNRKRLKKAKTEDLSNYKLGEMYQLRENIEMTTRVTIPLIVSRICTDSIYLLMQGTVLRQYFATDKMSTYIYVQWSYCLTCLYTVLAIFIPYYRRLPRKKLFFVRPKKTAIEEAEAHFKSLNLWFEEAYRRKYKTSK